MFFDDPYVQMIPDWFENMHDTQMQHILNIYYSKILVGHVYVCIDPCGKCTIVALLPQIAKVPRKSQNNGLKISKLIWIGTFPLF